MRRDVAGCDKVCPALSHTMAQPFDADHALKQPHQDRRLVAAARANLQAVPAGMLAFNNKEIILPTTEAWKSSAPARSARVSS